MQKAPFKVPVQTDDSALLLKQSTHTVRRTMKVHSNNKRCLIFIQCEFFLNMLETWGHDFVAVVRVKATVI